MKSLMLILAGIIILFFEGCGTSETVTQKDYDLATEITATVGSTMLSYISAKSELLNQIR